MIRGIVKKLKSSSIYPVLRKIYLPQNLKKKLFNFQGEFEVNNKEGKRFKLYNQPFHLETEIYWQGIDNFQWEIETRKLWNKLSSHSDVIFDIGSNTGIFAVLAKVYNENAKVFAFEPQPNIFKILSKNNEINNFDIQCENIALSREIGQMPFYNYGNNAFEENSTAGSLNPDWRSKNQKSIHVQVDKLDNYVELKELTKIDLVKIDVESHEVEVLEGYLKYLEIHQPFLIIEAVDLSIGKELERILNKSHYLYFNIDEKEGLKKVERIGESSDNNYLICHNDKYAKLKQCLNT